MNYTPLREKLGNRKKVAIVGFCQSSRDLTQYRDETFEVWGLNRGYLFMERADRWFEMHGQNVYTWQQRRPGKHLQWLNDFGGPVYMHQETADIKTCVVYPLKALADFFGLDSLRIGTFGKPATAQNTSGSEIWLETASIRDTIGEPYLSSSIAYEIALAIYEGFEEIHLYGVDLNTEAEYAWQKPGVEYWLGIAQGRGIKVVLPANCPLLRGTLYGRSFLSEKAEHMSYQQLEMRLSNIKNDLLRVNEEYAKTVGSRAELDFCMAQMMPGIDHEIADQRRNQFDKLLAGLMEQRYKLEGMLQETAYWVHQTFDGQEPREAMEQLKQLDKQELVAEGPITDREELQLREMPLSGNGRLPDAVLQEVIG